MFDNILLFSFRFHKSKCRTDIIEPHTKTPCFEEKSNTSNRHRVRLGIHYFQFTELHTHGVICNWKNRKEQTREVLMGRFLKAILME